jgi:phosphopantothenoylcysteine synthetase/decarboxylase
MRILVTAGNTQARIDQVRCITNIFTGKTGTALALAAAARGHEVTLLTSRPEVVRELGQAPSTESGWRIQAYETYEELRRLLEQEVTTGKYAAIIHSAAVSDYLAAGTYVPAPGVCFDAAASLWRAPETPHMIDVAQGKVSSTHAEVWLRLTPAPKLIDLFRIDWGFTGLLIKFKLEVNKTEAELREIAEQSRLQSQADWVVANTLQGRHDWALVGAERYEKISRLALAERVLQFLESRSR